MFAAIRALGAVMRVANSEGGWLSFLYVFMFGSSYAVLFGYFVFVFAIGFFVREIVVSE